jgi:hypothetical protein
MAACLGGHAAMIRIIPGIQVFVLVGAAVVAKLYFDPVQGFSWLDTVFMVFGLALLGWCFVPRDPAIDADSHKSSRQGFAFRLGKKLHKVLHLRRRDAAVRNEPSKIGD